MFIPMFNIFFRNIFFRKGYEKEFSANIKIKGFFEGILREGIFEENILLAETYCYN